MELSEAAQSVLSIAKEYDNPEAWLRENIAEAKRYRIEAPEPYEEALESLKETA